MINELSKGEEEDVVKCGMEESERWLELSEKLIKVSYVEDDV